MEKLYCNHRGNTVEYTTSGINIVETHIYSLRIISGMYIRNNKKVYETIILQTSVRKKYTHDSAEEAIKFHSRLCRTLSYIRYKKSLE